MKKRLTLAIKAIAREQETQHTKAVMKPREGTILTVASGIADKAKAELALETRRS